MRIEHAQRIGSEQEMEAFGGTLAGRVSGGCVIFLTGDLGAGKTTLVRGFLRALGHRGAVTSPTFTLLEVYQTGGPQVVHVDLYRLEDPDELEQLAIRDYLGEQSVLLVEWADRARGGLPQPDCEVRIAIEHNDQRTIDMESFTGVGEQLCAA